MAELQHHPALLGVGWIIGPKIAVFILVGGLIGWVILAPLIALATGLPTPNLSDPEIYKDVMSLGAGDLDLGTSIWGFFEIWGSYIRYIGVGAMVVGGLYTILSYAQVLGMESKKQLLVLKAENNC